jgi:hypothetical protein
LCFPVRSTTKYLNHETITRLGGVALLEQPNDARFESLAVSVDSAATPHMLTVTAPCSKALFETRFFRH